MPTYLLERDKRSLGRGIMVGAYLHRTGIQVEELVAEDEGRRNILRCQELPKAALDYIQGIGFSVSLV